jgi:hypothetical protein
MEPQNMQNKLMEEWNSGRMGFQHPPFQHSIIPMLPALYILQDTKTTY